MKNNATSHWIIAVVASGIHFLKLPVASIRMRFKWSCKKPFLVGPWENDHRSASPANVFICTIHNWHSEAQWKLFSKKNQWQFPHLLSWTLKKDLCVICVSCKQCFLQTRKSSLSRAKNVCAVAELLKYLTSIRILVDVFLSQQTRSLM